MSDEEKENPTAEHVAELKQLFGPPPVLSSENQITSIKCWLS